MKQHLLKSGWRFLPGGLTALVVALLMKLGSFHPLEQLAYQGLFQLRGPLPWDDRLVLVAIDDASLKQLGRFPWPRQYYTQFIDLMQQEEAGIVVVNLLWSESSAEDQALAAAMTRQGQVVLPQAWDGSGMPLRPVPILDEAAIAIGHVLKQQDSDGVVRQVDLQVAEQPALGVAVLQATSLTQTSIALPPLEQPLWINWIAPARQLRQVSFVDVVQGRVPSEVLRNRIVLLGVTATGLDPLVTPFDRNPATGSIVLHATVIQNLLQQNALRPIKAQWFWLILLLSGPGLSWVMTTWNTRQQLIVIVGLCSGWGLLSLLLFQWYFLLPVASPIVLFIATALASTLTERLRENYLLRQQVAQLWSHYSSDLVISPQQDINPLIPGQAQELTQPSGVVLRVAQLAALAEQFGRSQSTQAAIARTLSVGLLAADLDGRIWFCNPVASRWLQVAIGQQLYARIVPHWLTQEQWQASLALIKQGESVKHTNVQQDDRWFEIVASPLVYRATAVNQLQENPDGFLLLLEEVTEYKQVEKELQAAKEAAMREAARSAAANRSKSEFLANISHELRTPLNIILGFTQVMSHDQALGLEHQKHLDIINRSGQHLLNLINDVLEMSKIEAGRTRLNESAFNLHHLLDDLADMMRVKAKTKQLELIVERHANLPRQITTDEGKLRQVLLNLLGNAIKFTRQGRVVLRVAVACPLPDNDCSHCQLSSDNEVSDHWVSVNGHVLFINNDKVQFTHNLSNQKGENPADPDQELITLYFEVEDTGCGIAPEEIHKLFQPFVQAKAGTQATEGTGLGLAISQTFVNLMGGEITLKSTVDRGSTFQFSIQALCSLQAESDLEQVTQQLAKQIIGLAPGEPAYRILIVEDQQENSQFLVKLLTPLGFEVKEALNGQDAIRLWERWHPHLILMDIRMPVMDGYQATQCIRLQEGQQQLPRTKIIALSASVFEETEAAVFTAGCDDFLRKPVQENVLLRKLGEHLGIQYVYQSNDMNSTLLESDSADGTIENLNLLCAQMPLDWMTRLYHAANLGADEQIMLLIQDIPETHRPLAQALTLWANDFQFDEILNLSRRYVQITPCSSTNV